jgi:chromosome segregation ATPase
LKEDVQDYDEQLEQHERESQALRRHLEEARLEQQRLEDELDLRQQEIERLNDQILRVQKSKLESEKLAENEVCKDMCHGANILQQQRLFDENGQLIRTNTELSAQVKALRNGQQIDKSRETVSLDWTEDGVQPKEHLSNTVTIRDKDRQIDLLRLELADLEVRLAEQENSALTRTRQIEDSLLQAKLENIRLADDVESYQILLQDRTLKGEYPILSLESVPERDGTISSRSNSPPYDEDINSRGASLATELQEAEVVSGARKVKGKQSVNYVDLYLQPYNLRSDI